MLVLLSRSQGETQRRTRAPWQFETTFETSLSVSIPSEVHKLVCVGLDPKTGSA